MSRRWSSGSNTDHDSSAFDSSAFDSDAFDFTSEVTSSSSKPPAHQEAVAPLGSAAFDALAGLVLVNGDGELVSALGHSTGGKSGSGSTSGTGGSTTTTTGPTSTSPFVINVTYDASVANAPAGFKTVVNNVVQYLESQFTDHVTINIAVGYGEVGGYSLGSGALGESLTYLSSYGYAAVKSALTADARTADDAAAVATLPATSPVNGTFWMSTA